jgi:hypothetical protein
MLDIQGYKNTLRICNSYCFSTAAIAVRKQFNVTLFSNRLNTLFQSYTVWNSDAVVTQTINIKQTSGYKTGTFRNFKRQQLKWILIIWSLSWKLTVPYVVKKFFIKFFQTDSCTFTYNY